MLKKYWQSFLKLLSDPRLYIYLLPGFFIMLLYIGTSLTFGWLFGGNEVSEDAGWWDSTVSMFASAIGWVGFQIYQFFMITLLSPIMALLGEKADQRLSGKKFNGGIKRMMTDLWRTLLISSTAFLFFGIAFLIWSALAWVAGISELTPIIMFVVNAFFIGFAYMDYALERYQFKVADSWNYAFKNGKTLTILGAIFSIVFLIPYVGALFAPFISTLLGTAIWFEKHG